MTGPRFGYATNIADELMPFAHPLEAAHPHPDNVRKHRLEKIAQSLSMHGQRALVIVQKSTGHIVKGNGTWEAAKILGWHELAMSFQEMDDAEALKFLFADNRASDLATYDRKRLHAGLAKLVEGPGLLDTLWEVEEFEDLDEEFRGIATLPPTSAEGTGEQTSGVEASGSAAGAVVPGEKMREVPIVLTAADHALFVERLRVLKKAFKISSTIDTIVEAVRRQAIAEADGSSTLGARLDDNQRAIAIREWVEEFSAVIIARWNEREFSLPDLLAALRASSPELIERAPGQTLDAPVVGQVSIDEVLAEPEPEPEPQPQPVDDGTVSYEHVEAVLTGKKDDDSDFPF